MAHGAASLNGMKVAILVTDGFEQVEMTKPRQALDEAGAVTRLVSPKDGQVRGWKHQDPADSFAVDTPLQQAAAEEFDALVLPGGVANADQLRTEPLAVHFVRRMFEADRPVAVICHGAWILADAGALDGRVLTSWPSLRTDLHNAGAEWVDEEVRVDGRLVSSRNPHDLPAFCAALVDVFTGAATPQ